MMMTAGKTTSGDRPAAIDECACGRPADYLVAACAIGRPIAAAPIWIHCCLRCFEDCSLADLVAGEQLRAFDRVHAARVAH
jgi:hypothetical protein